MHDLGIPVYLQVLGHGDGAEFRYPPHIVAGQIHQHIMLAQLFFVPKELLLQRPIGRLVRAPGTGTGQRIAGRTPFCSLTRVSGEDTISWVSSVCKNTIYGDGWWYAAPGRR